MFYLKFGQKFGELLVGLLEVVILVELERLALGGSRSAGVAGRNSAFVAICEPEITFSSKKEICSGAM